MSTIEDLTDVLSQYVPDWLPGWLAVWLQRHPIVTLVVTVVAIVVAAVLSFVAMVAGDRFQGWANQWLDDHGIPPMIGAQLTRVASSPPTIPIASLVGLLGAAYLNAPAWVALGSALFAPFAAVGTALLVTRVFKLPVEQSVVRLSFPPDDELTTQPLSDDDAGDDLESVRELLRKQTASPESPLPPEEAFANAKANFDRILAAAKAGDAGARRKVHAAFDDANQIARQLWGSTTGYFEFRNPAVAQLEALTGESAHVGTRAATLPRLDVEIGSGSEVDKFLRVTNGGGTATVRAQAAVIADPSRRFLTAPYAMKWAESGGPSFTLETGQSVSLLVACIVPFNADLDTPAELDRSLSDDEWFTQCSLVSADGDSSDRVTIWDPRRPPFWTLTIRITIEATPASAIACVRRYTITPIPQRANVAMRED